MEPNVGGYDRVVRLGIGGALLIAGLVLHRLHSGHDRWLRILRFVLLYAGGDLLVTTLARRCPMNWLLGVNTCERPVFDELRRLLARLGGR